MAVEAGDVVFKFLGDATNLDEVFDSLGPKANAALVPAKGAADGLIASLEGIGTAADEGGDEIEEAVGKRGTTAIREARAEAGLLGEEFGVRLPRHVRSFIAEMPGVGEALSAAFSATAILFVAQAVIDLTKKVSEFVSSTFIFTEEMKRSTSAIIEQGVALAKQKEAYDKAEEAINKFGKSQIQIAHETVESLNAEIEKQGAIFRQASDNHYGFTHENLNNFTRQQDEEFQNTITLAAKTIESLKAQRDKAQIDEAEAIASHQAKLLQLHKSTAEAILNVEEQQAKAAVSNTSDGEAKKFLIEQEYEQKRYALARSSLVQLRGLQEQLQNADKVAEYNAQIDKLDAEHTQHYFGELEKQKDGLERTLAEMQKDIAKELRNPAAVDILPVNNFTKFEAAAKSLGITLRSDLLKALNDAKTAFNALNASGLADSKTMTLAEKRVEELAKAYDNFGKATDKFKGKTDNTWKGYVQDLKNGAQVTQNLGHMGEETFDQLANGLQGAVQAMILSQGSFSQAVKKATEDALASLASQALVKALFYSAEGFAAMAGFNAGSAAEYFEAAGIMGAVGAAAGLAAHAMSGGGGGSSSNTQQSATPGSNTSSQAGRGVAGALGIPHFATGGFITGPTLAMIGEGYRKEAVLPLEDPRAMREVGKAIGADAGGGGVHFHLPHGSIISADVMQKFVAKMNKMVNRGQLHVKASDSFRTTKRSA